MLSVQVAKDTFYATLRDRIAAGNTGRTVAVRGMVRPAVVVAENELPGASVDGIGPADTFCLRWTGLRVDAASGVTTLVCEVRYATDGTQGAAGLDRGRALAAMDGELSRAVGKQPQSAAGLVLTEISGGGAVSRAAAAGMVLWGDATFKPAVMRGERMERTAEVEVMAYGG